jgi:hypothetical protein
VRRKNTWGRKEREKRVKEKREIEKRKRKEMENFLNLENFKVEK